MPFGLYRMGGVEVNSMWRMPDQETRVEHSPARHAQGGSLFCLPSRDGFDARVTRIELAVGCIGILR